MVRAYDCKSWGPGFKSRQGLVNVLPFLLSAMPASTPQNILTVLQVYLPGSYSDSNDSLCTWHEPRYENIGVCCLLVFSIQTITQFQSCTRRYLLIGGLNKSSFTRDDYLWKLYWSLLVRDHRFKTVGPV